MIKREKERKKNKGRKKTAEHRIEYSEMLNVHPKLQVQLYKLNVMNLSQSIHACTIYKSTSKHT